MSWQDNFSAGLTPYSVLSGNGAIFTIGASAYGNTMQCASQAALTIAAIERTTPADVIAQLSFKFRITQINSDDAGGIALYDSSGTPSFSFQPMREAFSDSLRRPAFYVGAAQTLLGTGALPSGTWFQLDLSLPATGTAATVVIRDATTGVPLLTQGVTASRVATNRMQFAADKNGPTSASEFALVTVIDANGSPLPSPTTPGLCRTWPAGEPQ